MTQIALVGAADDDQHTAAGRTLVGLDDEVAALAQQLRQPPQFRVVAHNGVDGRCRHADPVAQAVQAQLVIDEGEFGAGLWSRMKEALRRFIPRIPSSRSRRAAVNSQNMISPSPGQSASPASAILNGKSGSFPAGGGVRKSRKRSNSVSR